MHFLASGGLTPPPPLAEYPAKNVNYFDVLPYFLSDLPRIFKVLDFATR